jgi:hypothetical protein
MVGLQRCSKTEERQIISESEKVAEFQANENYREDRPLFSEDGMHQTWTSVWLGVVEAWRGATQPAGEQRRSRGTGSAGQRPDGA